MQKCFKNICFKNGKSFVNVDRNSRESPNADFDLFLLRKEYNVCLKKEELSYMTLKSDSKFEEN